MGSGEVIGTAGIAGRRRIQRTPAGPAWCLTPRKPLFLRLEAPRPQSKCLPRRDRRGAPPPANPYSFVPKHHALNPNASPGATGVVLHPPQTLIPSSRGTTPLSQTALPAGSVWCLTDRTPLFLRPEAPRPPGTAPQPFPAGGAPTASSSPQDRAGPLRGSSADAAGTIRGNEIGLWMTADTFCQLSQSP